MLALPNGGPGCKEEIVEIMLLLLLSPDFSSSFLYSVSVPLLFHQPQTLYTLPNQNRTPQPSNTIWVDSLSLPRLAGNNDGLLLVPLLWVCVLVAHHSVDTAGRHSLEVSAGSSSSSWRVFVHTFHYTTATRVDGSDPWLYRGLSCKFKLRVECGVCPLIRVCSAMQECCP